MPTVPTLEAPTVEREPLPGRAIPRIDDSVNPQALGAPIAQGLGVVDAETQKLRDQHDQLRVIDASTQLDAARTALLYGRKDPQTGQQKGGAFSLRGIDAINMPGKFMPEYQKLADGIGETLTPEQKRMFSAHVQAGARDLNLQLNRYEHDQSNQLANEVFTNGAAQAVESGSVGWRDPAAIGKSRADIKALVSMQGDREGWPQEQKDENTRKVLGQLHYSVIDRMLASGRPDAALGYFRTIRDSAELTGEQAHVLGSQIDYALRQQQVDSRSAITSQLSDVRAAALNGQVIPPNQMPDKRTVLAAFPETGEKMWDGLQHDIQMGSDITSFTASTPEDIAAKVQSYHPTGVTGAAEGYDRYASVATAAQRVLSQRAADPRQYAIEQGLASNPIDWSKWDKAGLELRVRLANNPEIERIMGGHVPPLSKPEAAQLSQSLDSMTSRQKLGALAGLHDAVGNDDGFMRIMQQVLPHSPVTAVVGAQVSMSKPRDVPAWFNGKYAPNPADQQKILAGEALLNPQGAEKEGQERKGFKGGFPMPSDEGFGGLRQRFHDKTEDLFRGRPELAEVYFGATKAAYAALSAEAGDTSGRPNFGRFDKALQMAGGNLARYSDQTVSVPPGMDPTALGGAVQDAVGQRLKEFGLDPSYASKIRGFQLMELGGLGSGKYVLMNGNGPIWKPSTPDRSLQNPAGLRTAGNLDPYNRKVLNNPDGSVSTTSSMSIGTDAGETLIPTVVNGVRLSKEDAIKHFRESGEHLGIFDTADHADVYAQALHEEQARRMGIGGHVVGRDEFTIDLRRQFTAGSSTGAPTVPATPGLEGGEPKVEPPGNPAAIVKGKSYGGTSRGRPAVAHPSQGEPQL